MTVGDLLDLIEQWGIGRDSFVLIGTPAGLVQATTVHEGVAEECKSKCKRKALILSMGKDYERMLFAPDLFGENSSKIPQ